MFIDSFYHFCELLVHITTYFYIRFMLSLLNHTFSSMLLTLTLCQTFCQHLPSFFIFLSHELSNQQISTFLHKQGSWLSLCSYCQLCAAESGWLSRWLSGEEPVCQAGDVNSVPGLGRFPGEGNGHPLQSSCLGNAVDGGAWWAIAHKIARVRRDLVTKQPPPRVNQAAKNKKPRFFFFFSTYHYLWLK